MTQNTPFCKASTHQGDTNLFHPYSVGRQCLPNSLIACVMSAIEEPSNWTTETMDHILHEGDKLYQSIDTEQELLLPSDLPRCVTVKNRVCHIITGKEAYGSFVQDITETKIILSALCTLLHKTSTSALLCIGDKTGSSAIAVFTNSTSLFIFDSHSRDNSGMPCPNGTAVLMKFDNVDNTASYICELAHELSADLFHLTFWHAQTDVQCNCKTTSENPNIHAVGMLLHEEILELVSEYTPEVTREHRKKKYYTSYKKKVRQSETVQQTTDRKLCDKIQKQRKRANETIDETAERRLSDKKHKQTRKANETMEETAKRRLSRNKYMQAKKANETMEETAKRRLSDNEYRQTRKANETIDKTAERRLSDNKYRQKRRANETIEETAERRLCDKKHKQTRRANETLEESQQRKKADKSQKYKTRLSKKLKCPTIEDAMNNFKSECKNSRFIYALYATGYSGKKVFIILI